jgi:hypothetical protein
LEVPCRMSPPTEAANDFTKIVHRAVPQRVIIDGQQ